MPLQVSCALKSFLHACARSVFLLTAVVLLDTYLRIADFTSTRNLSDETIMTASEIPDSVTIFEQGAFWGDDDWLYIVGGETSGRPLMSSKGEFVDNKWNRFSAATVFKYEISSGTWTSEPALQALDGEPATNTFCCGNFGWNDRLRRGYIFSGSNYAGATQKAPGAPDYFVGDGSSIPNSNIMTFDITDWRWSNQTTDQKSTTVPTESGAFVFLPGTQSAEGGIAVQLGGSERAPSNSVSG